MKLKRWSATALAVVGTQVIGTVVFGEPGWLIPAVSEVYWMASGVIVALFGRRALEPPDDWDLD